MSQADESLSYRDAGVDIEAGNELIERIKDVSRRTRRPEVLGSLGGFAALCELPGKYRDPLLVSGTDGVGTKLKLALQMDRHDTVGIDLVAMCVNDLVVTGAEPLFFLDYYATGNLDVDTAERVITGIGKGCELAGCALVGGETAEMPGMYAQGDYDLAGFCVGVVERDAVIDGSTVKIGDALIGLASSGPHSNGYSLIRRIVERSGQRRQQATQSPQGTTLDLQVNVDGEPLADRLMAPTRIYVASILELCSKVPVRAMAHITGGGLLENLPRVLPDGCSARIRQNSWQRPAVFDWLQSEGGVRDEEMLRTFNCGVGMVVCVSSENLDAALTCLRSNGEQAWQLGDVVENDGTAVVVLD